MTEIWEAIKEGVMHALSVCLTIVAVILLCVAAWHLIIYYLTKNRVESAKQVYSAIRLGEPKERALALFRNYTGNRDQYVEEAQREDGKHEEVLCLQFGFGRSGTGEIRLTYVDNKLIQKQQNGIW